MKYSLNLQPPFKGQATHKTSCTRMDVTFESQRQC